MMIYELFPIPVLRVPADPETYDSIQIEIRDAWNKMQEDDSYSDLTHFNKRNQLSLGEKTYNFIDNYNCINLKSRIEKYALEYVIQSGWSGKWEGESPIWLRDSWLNVFETGDFHSQHCHPGYSISGVYYYRVDESFGSISFSNPNPLMFSCSFPQGNVCPQHSVITPTRGDLLFFPSWMIHSTLKNSNEEDRISVAFNIDLINLIDERAYGLVKSSHVPSMKFEL